MTRLDVPAARSYDRSQMDVTRTREPGEGASRLRDAVRSVKRVKGMTHEIYRYPARFSPEFVRACLTGYSEPGDIVLDPFVGGGTTAVEALASGRRFVGFDLNPLATLLTRAKTTPLYRAERRQLESWIERAFAIEVGDGPPDERIRNAPAEHVRALAGPMSAVDALPKLRQREAARAVLLATGQWAMDGRSEPVSVDDLRPAALAWLGALFQGIDEFTAAAKVAGFEPSAIKSNRILRTGAAAELARHRGLNRLTRRTRLVVTSPPYPGVHVLYHRWQVRGRRETPLPYWIADSQDGLGPKHYTMGGRTEIGIRTYFEQMRETWAALKRLLHPDALVIQLVAFTDTEERLKDYTTMMADAGYEQVDLGEPEIWRAVPNRRWYNRIDPARGFGREVLLAHRLNESARSKGGSR
jgi:DNA modification methylase